MKKRRFLSILLICCLMFTFIPMTVLAVPNATSIVYLNGWSGDDSNTGADAENAVKTLERAQELAGENGTIMITGVVTFSNAGEVNLSGVTVKRDASYNGALFSLSGNTTMNLSNVTLDGNKSEVTARSSLVEIKNGAVLNISTGAKLCNNSTEWDGGGVSVEGKNSKLYMNGGSIENNESAYSGGGIYCVDGGYVEITGGEIKNNSAEWGGGLSILVATGVLNGGSITGNSIYGNGAGVYLEDGEFRLTSGSITGNTTENGSGAGIFSYEYDGSSIVKVQGGNISENISTNDGGGDAICFVGKLELSGSPNISGEVLMRDDAIEDIKVDVVGIFEPTQPVTLEDNLWNDNRILVTYAEGLTPDVSKFQFTSEKWGARVEGQNIKRVEMHPVNIWVYQTQRYEYFYTMPGEPFDQSKIPSEAVTKAGYSVVGWTERKYDDDTVILGDWDMKDPVTRPLALHPVWKLDPTEVTLTAKDGKVHVVGGSDTLTAAVSHSASGITYHWKWYKGDELISDGSNNEQLEITEAGTYRVVVTATDGSGFSEPVEKSITIVEEDHIFPNNWNLNDDEHWKNCSICNTKGHGGSHIYGDWVVTKPATDTQEGEQEKTCTVCGHKIKSPVPVTDGTTEPTDPSEPENKPVKPDKEKPIDGDTNSPQTGDNSNIVLWIVAILASGTVLYNRKKKYSR